MKFLVTVVALSLSVSAFSLTLKEKKTFKEWNEWLRSDSSAHKRVKDKCGIEIPASVSEDMVTPYMEANSSAATNCDSVRDQLITLCGDKDVKEAVTAKVKKVDCKLGKKGEVAIKLNGSTLEAALGVGGANVEDRVKEYLENNL